MKRIITLLCTVALLISCNCNFRMITSVEKDGTIVRSFICPADSALLCGTPVSDIDESILPIEITDKWKLYWNTVSSSERHIWPMTPEEYNSQEDTIILTVERIFDSAGDMSRNFQFDIIPVKPYSQLEKKFKWFYTEYIFSETFPQPNFIVPVSDFLSEEEALFWFTGVANDTEMQSGSLIFEDLCAIAPRVNKWLAANYLAEASEYVANHYDNIRNAPMTREEFVDSIESFVKQQSEKADDSGISESWLEESFIRQYGSNAFMNCINEMDEPLLSEKWSAYMNFSFNYSVVMPGKPMPMPGILINGKVQSCNLNLGMIYPHDYILRFKSRDINAWAWLLCAFVVFFIAFSVLPKRK